MAVLVREAPDESHVAVVSDLGDLRGSDRGDDCAIGLVHMAAITEPAGRRIGVEFVEVPPDSASPIRPCPAFGRVFERSFFLAS